VFVITDSKVINTTVSTQIGLGEQVLCVRHGAGPGRQETTGAQLIDLAVGNRSQTGALQPSGQ